MKTCILFFMFCFCYGSVVFGHNAEVIYIDSGLMSYCRSPEANNVAIELYVYNIASTEMRQHYLPGTLYPTYHFDDAHYVSRFPLAWSVEEKVLYIIFPNLHIDAMNRISFLVWAANVTTPNIRQNAVNSRRNADPSKVYELRNDVTIYRGLPGHGSHFKTLSSCTFPFASNDDAQKCKILWYGLSGTNVIARLPFDEKTANVWRPCENPVKFRWTGPFSTAEDHENASIDGLYLDDAAKEKGSSPELIYCP